MMTARPREVLREVADATPATAVQSGLFDRARRTRRWRQAVPVAAAPLVIVGPGDQYRTYERPEWTSASDWSPTFLLSPDGRYLLTANRLSGSALAVQHGTDLAVYRRTGDGWRRTLDTGQLAYLPCWNEIILG
jgi:hypothetical protein